MSQNWKQETNCIQAGYAPKNGEPRMIPIVQSTTFKYDSSARMGALFDLEESGYFYTRLAKPHQRRVWPPRSAALEGGTAAMLTSSGQAANFSRRLQHLPPAGDHIVVLLHHLRRHVSTSSPSP